MGGPKKFKNEKRTVSRSTPDRNTSRRTFLKRLGLASAAGAIAGLLGLGANAQEPMNAAPSTGDMGRGSVGSRSSGSTDVAKRTILRLPKITYEKIRAWASQSEKYNLESFNSDGVFGTSVKVPVPDSDVSVVAMAQIGTLPSGTPAKDLAIRIVREGSSVKDFMISLKGLEKMYCAATGAESLEYVRLVVNTGESKNYGQRVTICVVPVDRVDGDVRDGVPMIYTSYFHGKGSITKEQPKLIAMR